MWWGVHKHTHTLACMHTQARDDPRIAATLATTAASVFPTYTSTRLTMARCAVEGEWSDDSLEDPALLADQLAGVATLARTKVGDSCAFLGRAVEEVVAGRRRSVASGETVEVKGVCVAMEVGGARAHTHTLACAYTRARRSCSG